MDVVEKEEILSQIQRGLAVGGRVSITRILCWLSRIVESLPVDHPQPASFKVPVVEIRKTGEFYGVSSGPKPLYRGIIDGSIVLMAVDDGECNFTHDSVAYNIASRIAHACEMARRARGWIGNRRNCVEWGWWSKLSQWQDDFDAGPKVPVITFKVKP